MKTDRCSYVKFYWGINSNFDKRFTEQKNYSANFLQWGGGMCGPVYISNYRCMQMSREWRDPTHLETSVSLHEDQCKSDQLEAANRGE